MALNSMEKEWDRFAAMVFCGTRPGKTQVDEMKKAFFAGALAMLTGCRQCGEPEVSEEEGVAYMEDRSKELDAFYRKVMSDYCQSN